MTTTMHAHPVLFRDRLGFDQRNKSRSITLMVLSCILPPLVVLYVIGAIVSAPVYDVAKQFGEGGMITSASSLMLAAGAAAAALTFYIKQKLPHTLRIYIWLILAAGLVFLALDDLIMIHEKMDALISRVGIPVPGHFRSWNDLIVVLYGVAALAGVLLSARELWRPALFLEFLAAGFVLYGIHTGIDTLVANPTPFSVIVEESAKILASSQFMLAMMAACVDQIDRHFAPGRRAMDRLVNS